MGPSSACPTFPRRPEVGRDRAWSSIRSTRAGLSGSWGCPPRQGTWRESTPCRLVQAPDWPSRLLKHVHERRKARERRSTKRAARSRVETIERMGENVTSNLLSVGLCNAWHPECFCICCVATQPCPLQHDGEHMHARRHVRRHAYQHTPLTGCRKRKCLPVTRRQINHERSGPKLPLNNLCRQFSWPCRQHCYENKASNAAGTAYVTFRDGKDVATRDLEPQ